MADEKVSASNINNIYATLESIRQKHYNVPGQNATANQQLASAFSTSVTSSGEKAKASNWDLYQTYLTALATSSWKAADTNYSISDIKPSNGTILQKTPITTLSGRVDTINNVCAFNSSCFGFSNTTFFSCFGFSNTSFFSCFGFSYTGYFYCFGFSDTVFFSCFGFSNTTFFSCFGFSNTTFFSCFGFNYTSNFASYTYTYTGFYKFMAFF